MEEGAKGRGREVEACGTVSERGFQPAGVKRKKKGGVLCPITNSNARTAISVLP
jgi:hypothetical protein